MKIKFLALGKFKNPACAALAQDYGQRLRHLNPIEIIDVSESSEKGNAKLAEETARIQKQIKDPSWIVLLDERGESWPSSGLARKMEEWLSLSKRELVFVVGGAYGFSEELKKEASQLWSLSKLTLTHELARVVALEQIYRALTILKHIPYHH